MSDNKLSKKYSGNRVVANRFGRKDRGWPWRQRKRDPEFPAPDLYLNGHPLWEEATLEGYEQTLRVRMRAEGRS